MKTILLVEDDKKLAALIQTFLAKHGYDVSCETRGDKAVYRILNEQPDLLILDVMLPGLDGLQVCASIRANYNGMILMLTASADDEIQINGLNIGADDFVIKPIQPKVLAARIDALSRRTIPKNSDVNYSFGKLQIDLIKHTVKFDGELISLKPKEFELLKFLASNADRIVNRDNISFALNGTPHDGVDRNIDLRISYLRRKLFDDNSEPYRIKTIRSKGYLFLSDAWEK